MHFLYAEVHRITEGTKHALKKLYCNKAGDHIVMKLTDLSYVKNTVLFWSPFQPITDQDFRRKRFSYNTVIFTDNQNSRVTYLNKIFDLTLITFIMAVFGSIELEKNSDFWLQSQGIWSKIRHSQFMPYCTVQL